LLRELFKKLIIGVVFFKNLKDKKRSGRLITAMYNYKIFKMRKFIKIEPYCTYDEIEAEVQISLRDYKQYITSLFEAKKKFRQDGYLMN
jgi:hypothetical protein